MAAQYRWDDFLLDVENFRLERAGTPLPLEPKALNLLVFLVDHPGRLVTKQDLFDAIWPDTAVTDHALTRVIAQLRRVLGDEARDARFIETVPTRGYRWIRPLDTAETPVEGARGAGDGGAGGASSAGSVAAAAAPLALAPGEVPPRRVFRAVMFSLAVCVVALLTFSRRDVVPSASAAWAGAERSHVDASGRDLRWPVQVTTRSGLDLQPAFSPRGDEFAYVADHTGALEIYVRAVSGGAIDRPLTSDGAQNVQPVWSPDGRQIAYHSSARGGIWVIPAGGGSARQLVVQGSQPAWSPDGSSIVFQSDEHADVTPSAWAAQAGSTLWRVAVAGGAATQLTFPGRPGGGHASPVWSPDSRFIAFAVFDGGRDNGVWVLDVRTGATSPLARGERLYELAFAPDGTAIYAAGGEPFVVRLPFDPRRGVLNGDPATTPIGGVPGVRGLSISADGKALAFGGIALSSHIWAQPIAAGIATGPAQAITSDTSRRNSLPVMSPDGSKIAYLSTRGGAAPDLWVMDADGTNAQQVVVDDPSDPKLARKRWMPDSRRLAYVVARDADLMVSSIDVTTRREERLFSYDEEAQRQGLPGQLAELQVSPSITQVAFSLLSPPEGRRRLYVSSLKAMEPRAIANHGESVGYPAWSPDERFVAVELKEGSSTHAATIEVATGNLRRLTNARGHTWVRSWSPDGRQVVAAVLRDGQWSIRAIDAATGRETVVVPPVPPRVYLRYPEWSPRNDLMLFERGELRGNIWTMSIQ